MTRFLLLLAPVGGMLICESAVADSGAGCLSTDTSEPITWTLPNTPGLPNWAINSDGYTIAGTPAAPVAVPFSATFWRRSQCPTQLILTLNVSGSVAVLGAWSAFQAGVANPFVDMIVNDPAIFGGNDLYLIGPTVPPAAISGIVNFVLAGKIDPSQAMTIDFTPQTFSGAGPVVSVQIPAAITSGPPPAFTIGPGITGNWDNPTEGQGGHGVQFEILPNNGMLAIWFVFTPNGSGPTWIYAQGSYTPSSNAVTLPAYISQGPKFPPNYSSSADMVTQWGTLTFTFTDCNNGTASWQPTAAGYTSGSMPIARVTLPAGLTCP
jgi:hypothetical protein